MSRSYEAEAPAEAHYLARSIYCYNHEETRAVERGNNGMKAKALVMVALAAVSLSLAAQPKKSTPKSLVLLYTASADGQVRSCNCTKFRFGGYGREYTTLKSIRSKSKDVLLIEGGDICGGSGFQADLKADVAAQAVKLLGYGAMVPGEKDLGVRGVSQTKRFVSKTALVCANIFRAGESKPVFPPYVILKTSGGLRVAVIGMIDKSLCTPWLTSSFGQIVKEPVPLLPALVKETRKKADLVMLVYHGTVKMQKDLADVKGIDLILTTHRHSQGRLFPAKGESTVDAPVGKLGNTMLIESETSTNWCLGRLDIQLDRDHRIKSAKHKLLYLDRSLPEDPAMVAIYDAYNENVKKAMMSTSIDFKNGAEAMLKKRGLNLVEMRQRLRKSPFATSGKCKDCHPQIYDIWSNSKHAHAMATLEKTKQEFDPECVQCHATGVNARNGFVNAKDTPELSNVQCESCHGAALAHTTSPKKGFGQAGEQVCRSCHTDERTPNFDYPTAWAKIMH